MALSGSVSAGWLNQWDKPTEEELFTFLNGESWNGSGGYWFGGSETWVNDGRFATEFGWFSPQIGGGWHDSRYFGNVTDAFK